ncbi:MAG: glutamate--tRNA ligase [Tissierellia bacterium]|nr:glutamate--tRNA ligase [Tissierellia bacterium]
MENIRLRFAPSPTGFLHIGGLRTALYNHLFAKKMGGKFILRIEDTDQTRFVDGAIENLISSLEWAGVTYDEGVFVEDGKIVEKGDYGPYIQSKRLDIYRKYVDELVEKGHAYYCFCSKDRLDNLREEQKIKGLVPKYDGLCRGVSLEEAKKRAANGEEYVIRMKLPPNKDISFKDLVRGNITINTDDIDDQVLLKSDGFPTYHMAVVVDDHLMGISHVVRGEEWLPSTPKHVYLYEAFGWEAPIYVHLPTVLNKDRKKLSKRHGDVSVEDFKASGYLPEALVNYLALVGWSPDSNQEIFSMDEMIENFSFDRVSKTGGIFDRDKLIWVNSHYIREKSNSELIELTKPYFKDYYGFDDKFFETHSKWLEVLMATIKEDMPTLKSAPEKAKFAFEDYELETDEDFEVLKGEQVPTLLKALKSNIAALDKLTFEDAKGLMKKIQKETGIKGKNLFMPTRIAITGNSHGPELANVLYLLGKDKLIKRIEACEEKLGV